MHASSDKGKTASGPDLASRVLPGNTRTSVREQRLERLIRRLPQRAQATVRWLRRPSSRWIRLPAGVLLIAGSFLSVLPLFGLWMLPLGLMLLAEDVPPLQRAADRVLDWLERRRPRWFAGDDPDGPTSGDRGF